MKAEILFVTVAGLMALMFLGLQLISTETASMPDGVKNSTAYGGIASTVSTLFVGAGAIWVGLLVVIMMVVFYAYMRLMR
jgi:hypothetical protein